MKQTVPDAMHTIKDAIEHFFYLIVRKNDLTKVIAELKRLCGTTIAAQSSHDVPYCISKEQIKIANTRASSIICPDYVDFKPTAFFSKTQFNSHDWKQVRLTVTS